MRTIRYDATRKENEVNERNVDILMTELGIRERTNIDYTNFEEKNEDETNDSLNIQKDSCRGPRICACKALTRADSQGFRRRKLSRYCQHHSGDAQPPQILTTYSDLDFEKPKIDESLLPINFMENTTPWPIHVS
mmetsp:Transcript_12145/g.16435  ORF Transcript_12145/g.16435 Transcript_12145/m.16435 type:complete len:135 (+) Transcript_12145:145-549(+)